MKKKLIIIGAGGHSKSITECIDEKKYNLIGFIDENKLGYHYGYPILGKSLADIEEYKDYSYIIGIGDNEARKKWFEKLNGEVDIVNIIDKSAIIAGSARIGKGNFIGKNAVINADVIIGDNNIVNTRALIEHECKVGNNNHLSTNSVINGNVVVGDNCFLGSCSVCIGQLEIGDNVTVGAGAVVIGDVESDVTVVGVPAKILK